MNPEREGLQKKIEEVIATKFPGWIFHSIANFDSAYELDGAIYRLQIEGKEVKMVSLPDYDGKQVLIVKDKKEK